MSTSSPVKTLLPTDCLRLAIMGGPAHYSQRGMTLAVESDYAIHALRRCWDLELVIECQTQLLARAERIYNRKTIEEDRALLRELENLRGLPQRELRHRMLDLLFPEN